MKAIGFLPLTLLLASLLIAGCQLNEFSSKTDSNQKLCTVPADVFGPSNKVSVNSLAAELEVIIKNTCDNPGKITELIELDPHAIGKPGVRSYSLKLPDGIPLQTLKEWAQADPCVEGISEDVVITTDSLPGDPKESLQKYLTYIKAAEAYPLFYGPLSFLRKPVVIAVVDSGLELSHEDVKDILWKNEEEIAGNGIDDDDNGYVDDVYGYNFAKANGDPSNSSGKSHGTHVAGLAAAQGYNRVGGSGAMPKGARLMTVNVFGDLDYTKGSSTANGVRYAADNGADVINLSLGGAFSDTLKSAIVYAIQKGVTVLAAAGNSGKYLGTGGTSLSPAIYGSSLNGLITVGSVSATTGEWSSFSNYSSTNVEIAAPGAGGMYAPLPGNTYGYKSGTSMATPVTAGAAGLAIQLIRAHGYRATPARVELALRTSATYRADLIGKVVHGRVLNLKQLAQYIHDAYGASETAPDAEATPPPSAETTVPCP
jgi:subtilisin family serine protease